MIFFRSLPRVLAAIVLGGWSVVCLRAGDAAQGVVAFDALVRNYNLVTFGNAAFSNYGDTEGGLAVGGNLTLGGTGSIASHPNEFGLSGDPTLYVAGQLNLSGDMHLNSGYASLPNAAGWTWNNNDKRLVSGGGTMYLNTPAKTNPLTNPGPEAWDWTAMQASAIAISNSLAAAAVNGTISVSGNTLMFVSNGASAGDVVVFELDAAYLDGLTYNGMGFTNITAAVPDDVVFVVNVVNADGKTLFGTKDNGANFTGGSGYERLLWNILPETDVNGAPLDTTVALGSREFYGSVLAPLVDVSNSDRVIINGQIVAGSYTHTGNELHHTGFDASGVTFSAVPEPSTYGLAALGLCGLAIGWQRWRRRQAA